MLITGAAIANLAWLNIGLAPAALSSNKTEAGVASFAKVAEPPPGIEVPNPLDSEPIRNAAAAIEDAPAIEDALAITEEPPAAALDVVIVDESVASCSADAIFSRRVHFARASVEIDQAAAARLNAVIKRVRALRDAAPGTRLVLDGHTDRRGDTATNDELGEARARAVAAHTRARGLRGEPTIRSFGARRPIAAPTPSTRWRNRRVVVCLSEVTSQ